MSLAARFFRQVSLALATEAKLSCYSFARSENTGKSWDFVLLSIKAWLQKYPSNSTRTSSHYTSPSIKGLLVKTVGHGLFPMPTCRALSHADFLSAQDRACALQLDA